MDQRESFESKFRGRFDMRRDPNTQSRYFAYATNWIWEAWQAAIAAASQQAAKPKAAMTEAQQHGLRTCINGGTQMGWISDDDSRAILAAAGVSLEAK